MSKPSLDPSQSVPLYLQCANALRKAIRGGKYRPGDFLPPERDLSRQFGVTRITLRKALAGLAGEGLVENVPGAGNRVAAGQPRETSSRIITCAMLRQAGLPMLSPYYAELFEGIQDEAAARRYDVVFAAASLDSLWLNNRPRPSPRIPGGIRTLGALLVGGLTDELALAYRKKGLPVVLVDKPSPGPELPSIIPDNAQGAYLVTRHLLELGHRRLAFLGAPPDPVSQARFSGFRKALGEAGVAFDAKDHIDAGYTSDLASSALKRYLARHARTLPTAIVAINDEAAIGALQALRAARLRVPDDVSVTGFDDIPWALHSVPPLTTMKVPRREMGRVAAQTLIAQIESPHTTPIRLVLQTDLIVRASTAAPKR